MELPAQVGSATFTDYQRPIKPRKPGVSGLWIADRHAMPNLVEATKYEGYAVGVALNMLVIAFHRD